MNDFLTTHSAQKGHISAFNPTKRAISKISLNAFWGKLGQLINRGQTKIVTDGVDFTRMLFEAAINVVDFHILDENIAQVEWKYTDEFAPENCMTNVFIAAFTTAQARLKLYNEIDKLGRNILYFDTDSVIFLEREGEYVVRKYLNKPPNKQTTNPIS